MPKTCPKPKQNKVIMQPSMKLLLSLRTLDLQPRFCRKLKPDLRIADLSLCAKCVTFGAHDLDLLPTICHR